MCRLRKHRIWDYWLAAVLGSFAALEYPAVKHSCHDPLSAVLSKRHLGPVIFALATWLLVHLFRYVTPIVVVPSSQEVST